MPFHSSNFFQQMNMKKPTITRTTNATHYSFDCGESGYRRRQNLTVTVGSDGDVFCSVCQKECAQFEYMISMDTSDGEYGDMAICQACIRCIHDFVEKTKTVQEQNSFLRLSYVPVEKPHYKTLIPLLHAPVDTTYKYIVYCERSDDAFYLTNSVHQDALDELRVQFEHDTRYFDVNVWLRTYDAKDYDTYKDAMAGTTSFLKCDSDADLVKQGWQKHVLHFPEYD